MSHLPAPGAVEAAPEAAPEATRRGWRARRGRPRRPGWLGRRGGRGRSVRGAGMSAAAALLGGAAFLAAALPVPYVVLEPGPTANTLGAVDGTPLLRVEGRRTYPTNGHLELTTVSVSGGPGRRVDLIDALRAWVDPRVAVVPEEQVYPRGQSRTDIERRNAEEMDLSQQHAIAAALRALDVPFTEVVVVRAVVAGSPADGVLQAGDVVTAVDGAEMATPEQVRDAIRARRPGESVRLELRRDDKPLSRSVPTRAADDDPDRAVLGIVPDVSFDFPFTVDFGLHDVGGPSAGLMFSLGIVDKLTPGALTDGGFVAGTGTIAPDGRVGPIGGIQQKLVAAGAADADLFLAPEGNCPQVAGATPAGLRVVPVGDIDDALDALEALRADRVDRLATCAG